jgi:hypothetical protein
MTCGTHESRDLRPPEPSHVHEFSWVPLSPTVRSRPLVHPRLVTGPVDGADPRDLEARRLWVGAIGACAVADLMRLQTAARRGTGVLRPVSLPLLVAERLARWETGRLEVPDTLPPMTSRQLALLRRTGRHRLVS